jgi:uncharacterized protein YdeI (YjbR/CyaY-like superfamily)
VETPNDADIIAFTDAAQWESWLADNGERQASVWLKLAKKNSGVASVTLAEALDVALCYGWIDGQRKSYDEAYFLQRYCRRRPKSSWSKINTDRAGALIAAGRMQPPGLAAIQAARADGRWDAAYESQRNATVPPDLLAALASSDQARSFFDSLGRTGQYAAILRLLKARTPEMRAAYLEEMIARLEAGKRIA